MTQAAIVKKPVTKITFPHHDFLSIEDLNADDITALLDLAEHYVVQNRRKSQTTAMLRGIVVVNVFLENSTGTRLSFEMAAKRLGAEVLNLGVEGSSIYKGESFTDIIRTVGAMLPDLVVVRHKKNGAALEAARLLDCPVLSGGDGTREHPTQALADALTLRRHFGRLEGLKVAICGDIMHSRVAHSNITLLQKMGANVVCAGPQELLPALPCATSDMTEALKDADAVMALRIQKERMERTLSLTDAEYFHAFGIDEDKMKHASPAAVVLHPGPMNRGVEIDNALADDDRRSLIRTQIEMGVAVRMACLDLLTRNSRR
jgi:aspartate carbamoyltransferase catalytic subunit